MSTLPFTVQDDIEAKEKYASTQQHQNSSRHCNSRRLRLWTLLFLISIFTLGLVSYFGKSGSIASVGDDGMVFWSDEPQSLKEEIQSLKEEPQSLKEEPQSLKEEILQRIQDNQLIVFSKTYCPFSKKAKAILSKYNLKTPLQVIEVDLRDDDYQVKMVLKEISERDTFPNIFLDGKTLGGSDNLEELHETGKLKILLNQNQLLA